METVHRLERRKFLKSRIVGLDLSLLDQKENPDGKAEGEDAAGQEHEKNMKKRGHDRIPSELRVKSFPK